MVQKTFQVAEVEITYRPNYKVIERPHQISSSTNAYNVLIQQWHSGRIELVRRI